MDEETLSQFAYRSPIDREFIAALIERIDSAGAKAIAVDVLIDQPSEPSKDDRLYSIIRTAQTPLHFSFTADSAFVTEAQLDYMRSFVPEDKRVESRLLSDPFDGLVRRISTGGIVSGGRLIYTEDHPPSFAAVMASYLDAPLPRQTRAIAWRPLSADGEDPISVISASYVQHLPPELFAGKIVLIGAVLSITDRHPTPLSIIDDGYRGLMPGILIQAHAIDSLVADAPEPISLPLITLLIVAAFTALGVLISQLRKGLLFNVSIATISLAAYWVIAVVGYAERYRTECNARGIPIGVTRIGIHTGLAVVGNFGSSQRMDFTALGDSVNIAARTEGINKYLGTRICVTQPVVDQSVGRAFCTIGHFALKGKAEYMTLYTPLPDA